MHWFVINLKKIILGHVLSKNPAARFFQKKSFELILSHHAAVTSWKKSEMFHALIFDNAWKTSFWAHFDQKT